MVLDFRVRGWYFARKMEVLHVEPEEVETVARHIGISNEMKAIYDLADRIIDEIHEKRSVFSTRSGKYMPSAALMPYYKKILYYGRKQRSTMCSFPGDFKCYMEDVFVKQAPKVLQCHAPGLYGGVLSQRLQARDCKVFACCMRTGSSTRSRSLYTAIQPATRRERLEAQL
jgi:hypothetical protein